MTVPEFPTARLRLSVRSADARVELAAASLLDQVLHRLKLDEVVLPIPIDDWIERPLGYQFEIVGDDELGADVLGLARPLSCEILIHEALLDHEPRYRFTCAHELGHLVLHAGHAGELSDAELPRDGNSDSIEREADRFASALLMPLRTLPGKISEAARASSLDSSCLELLRGDGIEAVWVWRRCILPFLCETYGVSRSAMIYRCRELRLPKQRRLVRPSLVPLLAAPERVLADLPLDRVRVVDGRPVVT